MNTLVPAPPEQVAKFRATLEPACKHVCEAHGMDPMACMAEAIALSGCGRYSVSHNYWHLPGRGSRGSYLAVVAPRVESIANGGVAPQVEQRAKFSTPYEAVEAWCAYRRQ